MRQALRNVLTLCVAAACIAGVALLHGRISELKGGIAERIAYIEIVPAKQQRTLQLQEQLTLANQALKQLSGTLVSRDDLSVVITNISHAAQLSSVAVQIPEVESEAETAGPLQDVRIRMNAVGAPAALIVFLYRVEHMPYIIRMSSWTLDTTFQSSLQSFVGSIPPDSKKSKPITGSVLAAEIIISLKKQ